MSPITVMIVDDEHLERVLISKSFPWEETNMEITGYYESGSQAFAAFRNKRTDLVLTDINMPFMDGLELAGKMKELSPATEIIIITGFDEFEYAKRGIQIGVMSYLLKPINRRELAEALTKARTVIMDRRREGTDGIACDSGAGNLHVPDILRKVTAYLDEHYTDASISLKSTARLFYVNESYLSRIFKLYCGKTFLEYVLQRRMEKAKFFIRSTSMKNYEIAERVGIFDANYFGQCFKRYTGMTVNQYRRKG